MASNQLWYTRRGREIRGPFPKKLISRYLLIGRVLENDEVSSDQCNWRLVSQLPELIPEEMKADLSIPENMEKLRMARLREDERKFGDRRQQDEVLQDEIRSRRSGEERRDSETAETLRHRLIKTNTNSLIAASKPNYRMTAIIFSVVVTLVVALVIGITVAYTPGQQTEVSNCTIAAQPKVDWSNCHFEGLQLGVADLQEANLKNTSLVGANIDGVNLSRAQLSYSNLLNANIRNADLSESVLLGAVLRNAKLNAVNLRHSDLHYAVLRGADLTNADLSYANLSQAMLAGAVIDNTKLNGAILDGAIWVDNTICAPESIGKCISVPAQAAR